MATERAGAVTFKGTPLTAIGDTLNVGDTAPDFTLLGNDLSPVSLGESAGKARLISVVPSLDTPVCDMQTRKFNEAIGAMGEGVCAFTISADLPFAQARWCGAAGAENVKCLSDHRDMSFGDAYGTHVKELRLESRAVFVLDKDGKITHAEYITEIADQPDYDAALKALEGAAGA